jgi:hypothetical protein
MAELDGGKREFFDFSSPSVSRTIARRRGAPGLSCRASCFNVTYSAL